MNYAIIDNTGLVVNVILWDGESEWQPPEGYQAVELTDGAGIGWTYADGVFTPPAIPDNS
jgi:hypothetical protein